MDIATIKKTWSTDCVIDRFDLTKEMARVYTLHSKYLDQWDFEVKARREANNELKKLKRAKYYHYLHGPSPETKDWPYAASGKIMPMHIDKWMEADPDLQAAISKSEEADEKVKFLDSVLSMIKYRNTAIAAMMEHEKFRSGQ